MATEENKIIFSVEVDNQEAIKALDSQTDKITELTSANERLRKEQKAVDDSTTEGLEERKKISKQIAFNTDQLKEEKTERGRLVKSVKTNANSYDALSQKTAKLRKAQKALDTSTKAGRLEYKKLEKQVAKNNATLKKADANVNVFSRNVGNYADGIGQLSPALGSATSGIGGMTKAAMVFIATPVGAVIAAIVAGLALLKTFFGSSEKGQNALNKASKIFTVILGNFQDLAANAGEKLFDLFNDPKQAISDLGNFLKERITNVFHGWLELFPALGKAMSLLFKGEFKEAGKTAADALGKVAFGVENITTKIKEQGAAFAEEMSREIKEAQRLADLQAQLDLKERALIVDRAKLLAQIAVAREKSNDADKFTAEERIKALEEVAILTDKLAAREVGIAKDRAKIKEVENSFSLSTKEDLTELEELRAVVFNKEQERANIQLRILRESKRVRGELLTLQKAEAKFIEESNKEVDAFFDAEMERNDASVDNYVASEQAKTEATKAEQEKRAQLYTNAFLSITNATSDFLTNEDASFKEFGKLLVGSLLDQLQAVIIAKNAEILAQSLATPDSILSFGASGAARAALLIGATQAAFGVAKAGLSKLADGGEVKSGMFGGNYHSGGGTTLSADGVPVAEVEKDERFFVVNRKDSAMINQLSAINSRHGKAFSTPMRFLADGGEVQAQTVSDQRVIDIVRNTPIFVKVVDINNGQAIRAQVIDNGTV